MADMVNNPPHYKLSNGMEVIDIIEEALTPEEFRGYLKGNDIKYLFREPHKGNSEQDVSKSIWYAERYKEALAKKAEAEATEVVADVHWDEDFGYQVAADKQDLAILASKIVHPAYSKRKLVLTFVES